MSPILDQLKERKSKGLKSFAVLIDPDKVSDPGQCIRLINLCAEYRVDFLLVGGSLITEDHLNGVIQQIKNYSEIPVVLFPGNSMQIDLSADALLFLSLISGRNPEFLIGQHVLAAPFIRKSTLEVIPTGYLLVDSGKSTTVSYMSHTIPIPRDKPEIAVCTAMAGEMLGLRVIYMDAGSGAELPISEKMIREVRNSVEVPLIIGGGLRTPQLVMTALTAGADMVVIGNGIEKDPGLLVRTAEMISRYNESLNIH